MFFCYHHPIQQSKFTPPSRGIAVMPALGRGFCSIPALIILVCFHRDLLSTEDKSLSPERLLSRGGAPSEHVPPSPQRGLASCRLKRKLWVLDRIGTR